MSRPLLVLCPLFIFWVFLQGILYKVSYQNNAAAVQKAVAAAAGGPLPEAAERQLDQRVGGAALRGAVDSVAGAAHLVEEQRVVYRNMTEPVTPPPPIVTTVSTTAETPMPLPTVVAPAPPGPAFSKKDWFEMEWKYLCDEKQWPYVGSEHWTKQFVPETRPHYNSMAVFPNYNSTRMHGLVGIWANGTRAWTPAPMPPPIDQYPDGGRDGGLKNGGFYLNLSDALPLDREPADGRDEVCHLQNYNYEELGEVSIIITFYNEAMSTLLRSVHSVLNYTPPPLLREIILVDDHSNSTACLPGSWLYDYLQLLPKTKLLRLPERRGLVWARLAGAKLATADTLVVLDSHIEVNQGWLEPQLQRLVESPKSIVFPQIMAVDSTDFSFQNSHGIGCFLSFKWVMQEKATLTGTITKPDAIPSPSMAGGLFAVRKDWFWELGGYDEEFCMWGAENVEMGFRVWMCGGRLECAPCARVYHIYRKGGHAYNSPPECLWKNRLRTARLWTDEFYQLTARLVHHPEFDIGPLDKVLEMKERLQCKNFKWFLKNVHPTLELQDMSQISVMGEFRNKAIKDQCVDTLSHSKPGEEWGNFGCHGGGGTQGFIVVDGSDKIRIFGDESKCLGVKKTLTDCHSRGEDGHFRLPGDGTVRWKLGTPDELCMALVKVKEGSNKVQIVFEACKADDLSHQWSYHPWEIDQNFQLPDFSPEYKAARAARQMEIAKFVEA